MNYNSNLFPFTTCEKPRHNDIIKQPVSAFVNIICCFILFAYLFMAKSLHFRLLIFSFLVFQSWHAFSHIHHFDGIIQTNVIHILTYCMTGALLYCIMCMKTIQSNFFFIGLLFVIIIDLYVWTSVQGIYMTFSGLAVLIYVVLGSWRMFPTFVQKGLLWIMAGFLILLALIWNEKQNCEKMLKAFVFPYHVFIETTGLILFCAWAHLFLNWEFTCWQAKPEIRRC